MIRLAAIVLSCCIGAMTSGRAGAEISEEFWTRLALMDDAPVVLSIKYHDADGRRLVVAKTMGFTDLPFINRVVARMNRNDALSLRDVPGIIDIEIFGAHTADSTFHKLLELYRVYLYQVTGRFDISAVNFSQGVSYWDRNSEGRGDRTIAEALDVLGSRIAPVFVAIGDGPEFGVGGWAMASSVLPVVPTDHEGESILPNSARPTDKASWKTILYADGAATAGRPVTEPACGAGTHLTADQMLEPEIAAVPQPGGSSFATFKATWNACFIHQFTEVVRVQLRARTAVGEVEVEPFVAYYVDSPVDKSCTATRYRWADRRMQNDAPRYEILAEDKARLDNFVAGNSIELRVNYSIPILKAFLDHLPKRSFVAPGKNERFVSSQVVLTMLRNFKLADLIQVAANRRNVRYADWIKQASLDSAPLVRPDLMSAIEDYCRHRTLFLTLSDEASPFFSDMPEGRR